MTGGKNMTRQKRFLWGAWDDLAAPTSAAPMGNGSVGDAGSAVANSPLIQTGSLSRPARQGRTEARRSGGVLTRTESALVHVVQPAATA